MEEASKNQAQSGWPSVSTSWGEWKYEKNYTMLCRYLNNQAVLQVRFPS